MTYVVPYLICLVLKTSLLMSGGNVGGGLVLCICRRASLCLLSRPDSHLCCACVCVCVTDVQFQAKKTVLNFLVHFFVLMSS